MAEHRVSDLARELNTTTTRIYRLMRQVGDRLSGHAGKRKSVTLLDDVGADLVRDAAKITTVNVLPTRPPATPVQCDNPPAVVDRIGHLEQAVIALIEANKTEAAAARAEAAQLRAQVAALSSMIEARRSLPPLLFEPPKLVEPWKPTPKPDPLAGKPGWYRLWVEITAPERLRRDN